MKFKIIKDMPFSLRATQVCAECGGNGMSRDDGDFGPCQWCGGTGNVETSK